MKFKDLFEHYISEERFTNNGHTRFKLPTMIKNKKQALSRNQLRKLMINTNSKKKVGEIIECIKFFCDRYVNKNDLKALVIRDRNKNTTSFQDLGLNFNDIEHKKYIVNYILKYINADYFTGDYPDGKNKNIWFYEFIIKDFRNNKEFMNYFPNVSKNILNSLKIDFYLKFSFRFLFDNNKIPNERENDKTIKYVERSSDGFLYINGDILTVLDNVSFHFAER